MSSHRAGRTGRAGLLCLSLGLIAGCEAAGVQPTRATVIGRFQRRDIDESSGVVKSIGQPGVYWTINDSGNEAMLFAFDSIGRDLGVFRVAGADNQDWESLGIARCAPGGAEGWCLFIGETGDNEERRKTRRIYRVSEPRVDRSAPGAGSTDTATRLVFTYEDGPHDVEGMSISGDGAVHLITKGRKGGILQFRLSADAWKESGRAVAQRVDSLPIDPDLGDGRAITDAAFAPDGRHLAVRTYRAVYLFRTDSTTGAIDRSVPPSACDVRSLDERGGEGLAWFDPRGVLLLTSEGRSGLISLVECPLPVGRLAQPSS